ncbi:MAG: Ppx/GppA phosphatase family protein [Planctomycetota bacterium]
MYNGPQITAELSLPPEGLFPLVVASIDVGSNAIRFGISEFSAPRKYRVKFEDRAAIRLGHGVFVSGKLLPAAMDSAVSAFIGFRKAMEVHGAKHYRAVATSAARESANGQEFIKRIEQESGIRLKVINGTEEARLVYLAVRSKLAFGSRQWLLAELGGGSVEVSLADDCGILATECHSMGSVRLLEALEASDDNPSRFRSMLRKYIEKLKVPASTDPAKLAGMVGTGGNIEAIAKLAGMPLDLNGVSKLPISALRSVTETLWSLSYRERIQKLGLREDRADVILPAAMVYSRLAELVGAEEIVIPHLGIKEGAMFDLVDELISSRSTTDAKESAILDACVAFGRKYFFDEPHALHVAKLSLSIFDQTKELHGLGQEDRELLLAAGVLHDIGFYIAAKGHHKHSHYIISNVGVSGFSSAQVKLIANIARYHRKADPTLEHSSFAQLCESDRLRVTKLASILRLADALDHEHRQNVYKVKVIKRPSKIHLSLEGSFNMTLEQTALRRKSKLFCKVFDSRLTHSETKYEREELGSR